MGYRTHHTVTVEKDRMHELMAVEQRIDRLELACAGLWDHLKTRHGYTDDDIARHIHEVDLRDGQLDGKTKPPEATCPHCNRKLATRSRKRCIWCGAELGQVPFAGGG